jgi:hypothetical protein
LKGNETEHEIEKGKTLDSEKRRLELMTGARGNVQLVGNRLRRKIGLLRPSFITISVNYAVALESHEPCV